jgi:hypothetical protein
MTFQTPFITDSLLQHIKIATYSEILLHCQRLGNCGVEVEIGIKKLDSAVHYRRLIFSETYS